MIKQANMMLRLLLLGLLLLAGGCHVLQKGYETARSASVDAVTMSRYRYDFKIITAEKINPGADADHNTLHMQIMQLRDQSEFMQADYYALLNQSAQVLGGDLLQQQALVLYPFATQLVSGSVDRQSRYIGLLFFFNQPDGKESSWKILLPLKDIHLWGSNYILVDGNRARLVAKKEVKSLIRAQEKAQKALKARQKAEEKARKEAAKARAGGESTASPS